MTRKQQIEAALHRSLQKQVTAPRLDASFNAAVWERVAAAEARIPRAAAPARGSHWLLLSNIAGIAVSVVLIVYFVVQGFSGVRIEVDVPVPGISEYTTSAILRGIGWGIAIFAVAFGFAFTGMGRRILKTWRAQFA